MKAVHDLIPEDDRKKFGFLTIDEIHEIGRLKERLNLPVFEEKLFMMIT